MKNILGLLKGRKIYYGKSLPGSESQSISYYYEPKMYYKLIFYKEKLKNVYGPFRFGDRPERDEKYKIGHRKGGERRIDE